MSECSKGQLFPKGLSMMTQTGMGQRAEQGRSRVTAQSALSPEHQPSTQRAEASPGQQVRPGNAHSQRGHNWDKTEEQHPMTSWGQQVTAPAGLSCSLEPCTGILGEPSGKAGRANKAHKCNFFL